RTSLRDGQLQDSAVLESEFAPQMDRRDHLQHVVVVPGDIGNDDGRRDAPGQRDRDEPPATRFGRWWRQEQRALLRDFTAARARWGTADGEEGRAGRSSCSAARTGAAPVP